MCYPQDDYFVLWEENILGHLLTSKCRLTSKARTDILNIEIPYKKCNKSKNSSIAKGSNNYDDPTWFSKAQDHMLDFEQHRAGKNIVGKLYKLCFKASEKHDGTYLPDHLHENIPAGYRFLLKN